MSFKSVFVLEISTLVHMRTNIYQLKLLTFFKILLNVRMNDLDLTLMFLLCPLILMDNKK